MTVRPTTRRAATVGAGTLVLALMGGPALAAQTPFDLLTDPLQPATGLVPVPPLPLPSPSPSPTPAPALPVPAPVKDAVAPVAGAVGGSTGSAPAPQTGTPPKGTTPTTTTPQTSPRTQSQTAPQQVGAPPASGGVTATSFGGGVGAAMLNTLGLPAVPLASGFGAGTGLAGIPALGAPMIASAPSLALPDLAPAPAPLTAPELQPVAAPVQLPFGGGRDALPVLLVGVAVLALGAAGAAHVDQLRRRRTAPTGA